MDLDTDWIRIQGHWNRIRILSGQNALQQNESTKKFHVPLSVV
jgi:hypothetical protein